MSNVLKYKWNCKSETERNRLFPRKNEWTGNKSRGKTKRVNLKSCRERSQNQPTFLIHSTFVDESECFAHSMRYFFSFLRFQVFCNYSVFMQNNGTHEKRASWKSWRNSFKFIGIWALNEFSAWKTCNYRDEQRQTSWETKRMRTSSIKIHPTIYEMVYVRVDVHLGLVKRYKSQQDAWKICSKNVNW